MIGVVFDGGGVKGSYQIGAYLALKKCGINPNIITGTSIGAFNGAMCASHLEKEAQRLWESVNFSEVFAIKEKDYNEVLSKSLVDKIRGEYKVLKSILSNKGIDTVGLKKFIDLYIDEEKLRKSDIDFGLATLNLTKLKPTDIYINQMPKGKLHEYILASAYLPGLKREKIIDDNNYVDGGFYNTCPVNMCIDAGCDIIYVVRVKGIGYNKRIKKHKCKIVYIETKKNLGSVIFSNQERSIYNLQLGYYDALRILKKLDGNIYYLKNRHERTYDLLIKKVNPRLLKRIQNKFYLKNNKKLIIKSMEYIMQKENYELFKIYGPILLIHSLKKLPPNRDIVYKFIKELQIV